MPILDRTPGRLPIKLVAGDNFGLTLVKKNNAVAVDITGYTWKGEIEIRGNREPLSFSILDAANGKFSMSATLSKYREMDEVKGRIYVVEIKPGGSERTILRDDITLEARLP